MQIARSLIGVARLTLLLCLVNGCGPRDDAKRPDDAAKPDAATVGEEQSSSALTRETLLRMVSDVKLVEHEFKYKPSGFGAQEQSFVLLAPETAKVEITAADKIKVTISPTVSISFQAGKIDMAERKKLAADLFSPLKKVAFADDSLLILESDREKEQRFRGVFNLKAGPFEFFGGTDNPSGDYETSETWEDCLLAVQCAFSLRTQGPQSENPLEVYKRLGVRIEPDTMEPADVKALLFPSDTTDATVALITAFKNLETLEMTPILLDGPALLPITTLGKLKKLTLHSSTSDDAEFEIICRCKLLEDLEAGVNEVTAEGLKPITRLTGLRKLSLASLPEESLEGLTHLSALSGLEELELDVNVGLNRYATWSFDDHLDPVAKLPVLRSLTIKVLPLRNVDLPRFAEMKQLKSLTIEGNDRLSAAAIKRLKQALPETTVTIR